MSAAQLSAMPEELDWIQSNRFARSRNLPSIIQPPAASSTNPTLSLKGTGAAILQGLLLNQIPKSGG